MNCNKPCGEIIESCLTQWTAQSWQWNFFVPFGSLVVVESGDLTIFGIAYQLQTGSMDPTRYPFPYQKTEKQLLQEQPQIFEFLKTTVSCITAGYAVNNHTLEPLLPPEPPRIHAFISIASDQWYKKFFKNSHFLSFVFNATLPIGHDELLLATLKGLFERELMTHQYLEELINIYTLMTGNDYRRLKLFLSRTQTLVSNYSFKQSDLNY